MPAATTPLGDFLRASRARVDPADTGLITTGSRRVAGLRREEVAVLAGVSADYYARLEQGRERNPSGPVVGAIGRALRLDADASGHLYRLAGLGTGMALDSSRDLVHPALLQLLNAFPTAAAYVLSPALTVLATNPIAAGLLSPFIGTDNMVRVIFERPEARTVFVQWSTVAGATVHALRLNAGQYPDDPQIRELVSDLLANSEEFGALWKDQTVGGLARTHKVFQHPQIGRVELTYQTFDVRDAPGQQLLVGTPTAGTSADAIKLLGSLQAVKSAHGG